MVVITKHVLLLGLAIVVTACTAREGSPPSSVPAGSSSPTTPSMDGSVPIAIPDVPGSVVHHAGEAVRVGDATVVFGGLVRRGAAVFAMFDVTEGALGAAELLVERARYPLVAAGSGVEAGPIDPSAKLDRDSELTLITGNMLTVFAAGPVR
jgi:hypothetical protein